LRLEKKPFRVRFASPLTLSTASGARREVQQAVSIFPPTTAEDNVRTPGIVKSYLSESSKVAGVDRVLEDAGCGRVASVVLLVRKIW
jgi:hypothetical protein